MAKELTDETLSAVISKSGLKAAKEAIADQSAALEKKREKLTTELATINAQLAPLSRFLFDALKAAAKEAGVSLTAEGAAKVKGGKRERMTAAEVEAVDKAVLGALPTGKDNGIPISAVADAAKADVAKVRQALKRVGAKMNGSKKNAVWHK